MSRFICALNCVLTIGVVVLCHSAVVRAADNPFKGDYAARYTFTPDESQTSGPSKGLVMIAIYGDGHIRMSFINKSADSMYCSRGTIDNNGQFDETTGVDGKDWGTHKGTLTRTANGNITGTIYEYAKGKEIANGSYEIVGGTNFGETK